VTVPFGDRPPTKDELERFRLILSTYQDGSGMLPNAGATLRGWRDFERSVAAAFNGIAPESKGIFDVRLADPNNIGVYCGVSCKMRGEYRRLEKYGRVTIELSNSYGKFWDALASIGLNQTNYKRKPTEVGAKLLGLVHEWHEELGIASGGEIDLARSCHLSLSWNPRGEYQLHQFDLSLPDPATLTWEFPLVRGAVGRSLRGRDATGLLFEWYGESGGQLKYYPLIANATWQSPVFTLEPLVVGDYGIRKKAEVYFPERWVAASHKEEQDE
jgi:hypothetical protein